MIVGRDGNVLTMHETSLWAPLTDSNKETPWGGTDFLQYWYHFTSHKQLKEARWEICLAGMIILEILPD